MSDGPLGLFIIPVPLIVQTCSLFGFHAANTNLPEDEN